MRFEPDYDPDPLRSKFKTINSLDELPEDTKEMITDLKRKIGLMMEAEEKNPPGSSGILAYTAFQEMQIQTLQQEIKAMYTVLLEMASKLDDLEK